MIHNTRLFGRTWSISLLLLAGLGGFGFKVQAAGPEPAGWYCGDMHVHRSCGTTPEAVSSIYNTMVSQDLAVVSLLADMGNAEVQNATTDLPLVNGKDASVSTAGRIVHWDTEWHWDPIYTQYPHQALGGHIVALGLTNAQQNWSEYTYPIFDWAHRQGGIAGFAHFQYLDDSIPTSLTCCTPIEYPVEVALGACDFISEDVTSMTGHDYFIHAYYRLLNCGFRPGFAAGSDYPCSSVVGPIVTYSQVAGGQLTYSNWVHALAAGRTMVSLSGRKEFVSLLVNGTATPGDEIQLSAAGSVPVTVTWTAQTSLTGTLELVYNGAVVASKAATAGAGSPVTLSATVNFPASGWLCARRMDPNSGHQAHTAAVFVTINHAPVRASAADAQFYVQWIQNLLVNTSAGGIWNSYFSTSLAAAQARYQAALSKYQQIFTEAGGVQPPAVPIGNSSEGEFTDSVWGGGAWINAARFQVASNTTASTMYAKVGAITGKYKCAIYADAGGSPSGFLRGTAEVSSSTDGWQALSLTSSVTLTNGSYYWLAIWSDDANARVYYSDSSGTLKWGQYNYGTWPNPITTTGGGNLNYCIYATGPTASLKSIVVAPSNPVVTTGGSQQFLATGTYSDGSTQDITSQVTWSSASTGVASVNSTGLATAISVGTATISATAGTNTGSTLLTVQTGPLAITTASVPNAVANVAYSASLKASGGTTPYTWSLASGGLPPGLALNGSSGVISGIPTATGTFTFIAQAKDASIPAQTTTKSLSITVPATMTIWASTTVPVLADSGPDSSAELGVKFKSDVSGSIAGIRFYKATANTGTHIGNLWTSTGTLLATATFSGETASGWQQVLFTTPVSIAANTIYVASCHCTVGHYSEDDNYFAAKGADNPPLHALTNGVSGGNGVYAYGSSSAFPNQTFSSANYWVDVVFQGSVSPVLNSITVTPTNPSILVGNTQQFTATGTYLDGSTQTLTSQVAWTSGSAGVATINAAGLAAGVSAGTANITAALGTVSGSTALTVRVSPTLVSIAVAPANPSIFVGGTQQFTATGTYSDGTTQNLTAQATWSTSAASTATVNTSGLASGVAAGSATVIATSGTVSGNTSLGVVAPPTLISISVTPTNPSIALGATQQFTATGNYSDNTTQNLTSQVVWTSSKTTVATVSVAGLATSVSAGTTTLSATLTTITGSAVLTVQPAPLSITTASLPNGTFNVSYSTTLAATGGTTPYSWVVANGSLPPRLTINASSGAIAGAPTTAGVFTFTVRVNDSGVPVQSINKTLSITVPSTATIWGSTTVPVKLDGGTTRAAEVGVKFSSDVAGTVAGIRFYKASANTGTHVGNLWTSAGTRLATATFTGETASGWQQVNFAAPVSINSNTVYVASYHVNSGHYSADASYFSTAGVDNPPLHVLPNSVTGGNGIYRNSNSSAFPNTSGNGTNYWVDLVFQPAVPPTLTSIEIAPANLTVLVGATQQFAATGTYSNGSTQNISSLVTWTSSGTAVATINANGVATAGSAGSTTISAALSGVTNGTTLTVQFPPTLTAISVTPTNATVLAGATQQFVATGNYSNGSTQSISGLVTWTSSSAAIATISPSGLATAVSAGTATISAALAGLTNATTLTVQAPPTLTFIKLTPANPTIVAGGTQQFTATGTYSDGSTQNLMSQVNWSSSKTVVTTISTSGLATAASVGNTTISATMAGVTGSTLLTVAAPPLAISTASLPSGVANAGYSATLAASGGTTPYTWSIASGSLPTGLTLNTSSGAVTGTPSAAGAFNFTARVSDSGSPVQTATGSLSLTITTASSAPILLLTNAANPFSQYFTEILLAEGLNEFTVKDTSSISSATLASYDVVLLGQTALTAAQVTTLSNWVYSGGNLIAMRPDKQLAGVLGLADVGTTLSEGYLLANTASAPGTGIVGKPIQFHGTADRYSLRSASSLATLYSNAQTGSLNPAVTLCSVGPNGGEAAAFTFDLARSVVYTRQGNPAWSGQERDGNTPIRSDDLYYGAASFDPEPNWVDLNNVAIPQADEQQRLFANLMIYMEANRKLLPRFWYFPHEYKAVVVMTGDDHAGTYGGSYAPNRFDSYLAASPQGGSVDDWTVPRCTAYTYLSPSPSLTNNAQAAAYNAAGFEIGVHLNTGCADYTASSLDTFFSTQMSQFAARFPNLPAQTTHRIHCIAWSDYTTPASVSRAHGIRLETSYYYWPSTWVVDTPGLFTGSGMPMRFSSTSGSILDVYQAATQMTDESGQSYPYTVDTLLDRALGSEGYYGAFVANMHTDVYPEAEADAVFVSALSRGVPIISARQLLTWLDARNGSSFKSIVWDASSSRQTFSVQANAGAKGLQAMVPIPGGYTVSGVKSNGVTVAYSYKTIKGYQYVVFPAGTADYEVTFAIDSTAPTVTSVWPPNGSTGVSVGTNVTVRFSEPMDSLTMNTGNILLRDSLNNVVPADLAYDASSATAYLTPQAPLAISTKYTANVAAGQAGVTDVAGNSLAAPFSWSFTTTNKAYYSIWRPSTAPSVLTDVDTGSIELGVKFRSSTNGYITAIRYYKGPLNTGTHVASLWSSTGTKLSTATFTGETTLGWQQVNLPTPVAITANTVYVASYHANAGRYCVDGAYFANTGVDSPPLHALANGESGGNGVYRYGTGSVFPNLTYNTENYWVDVVFVTSLP